MRLFFIRHGQSENNALWAIAQSNLERVSDPSITEIGRRQIEATARFMDFCITSDLSANTDPSCGFETGNVILFCSLMTRAIQSGTIISQRLNLPLNAHLDIHENGGIYQENFETGERLGDKGLSSAELQEQFPDLRYPSEMKTDGWWGRPFEERELRRERAKKVLASLMDAYGTTSDTLIFVSHAGFYNYFMREVLGMRHDTQVWFEFFNGAVTLLNFDNSSVNVFYNNRYDFMPLDIVT